MTSQVLYLRGHGCILDARPAVVWAVGSGLLSDECHEVSRIYLPASS